jgi:hypothetical protein
MERERERECKRAAVERKHELLRRCSYRWVDSVSGSDDRAPPFLPFSFLSPGQESCSTTGHHWRTRKAKILSSTHTHTPRNSSSRFPVQNLLAAHGSFFSMEVPSSGWPGTRIACRFGTGGPVSGCPEPNITGTSPGFWNRAGRWVLEPGGNRDPPPFPLSWLLFNRNQTRGGVGAGYKCQT